MIGLFSHTIGLTMSDEPSINDMPMRVVALKQEPQGKTR